MFIQSKAFLFFSFFVLLVGTQVLSRVKLSIIFGKFQLSQPGNFIVVFICISLMVKWC